MTAKTETVPFLKSPGIKTFLLIWFGQLISTMGSQLTGFALSIYMYEKTNSVWMFALNAIAFNVPFIFIAPFTGALVDRIDRKRAMIISDTGAGLSTLAIVLLNMTGNLEVWHIVVATFINAAFNTIQWPAWTATQTVLVSKEHLGRAAGFTQIGEALGQIFAPVLGGLLYISVGLSGIVSIDFATFLFAVITLGLSRIPKPEVSALGAESKQNSIWQDAMYGFKYIWLRKPLLGLLTYFATINFLWGMLGPLYTPLMLSVATPQVMGLMGTIIGVGMLAGTLVMSAWGGPQRKVYGLLSFGALGGFFIVIAGLRANIPLMTAGAFGMMFCMPILNACSQAIWQRKVEPDVQGRVFSARRVIAWCTNLPAPLVGAAIVENWFRPLMDASGPLAGTTLGTLLELGPARGISLLMMVSGLLVVVASGVYLLIPIVRHVETLLPDARRDDEPSTAPEDEALPIPALEAEPVAAA